MIHVMWNKQLKSQLAEIRDAVLHVSQKVDGTHSTLDTISSQVSWENSGEANGPPPPALERRVSTAVADRLELAGRSLLRIENFEHVAGKCWKTRLPCDPSLGDSARHPARSSLKLFENGRPLGPAHAVHQLIFDDGAGLYSHWQDALYFSTSDGAPPGRDREFHIVFEERLAIGAWRPLVAQFEALPESPTQSAVYVAIEAVLAAYYPEATLGDMHKSFWRERSLKEDYARLCGKNWRSFERKFGVINLLKLTHAVDGAYAECGVFEGATTFFVCQALEAAGVTRRILLFDSFQGLSAPDPVDGEFWGEGYLSAPEAKARKNLAQFKNVEFYPGWIPDRFVEVTDARFAFVHIDVDLHKPTLDSLEFFYPRMNSGGIILCDDYGYDTCPGARRAMDDFFSDKPEPLIHLPSGQGFVLKA